MVTKSKKSGISALPGEGGRILRSARKNGGYRVARRSGGKTKLELDQERSQPQSVHDRNRDSSVDNDANESQDLPNSSEAGEAVGDDLPDTP